MQDTILRYVQVGLLTIISIIAALRQPGVVPVPPPPVPQYPQQPQPPAQPPAQPPLLPIPKIDAKKAIARIQFGNASCTCTFVGPERDDGKMDVLSAGHCAAGRGQFGTVYCQDGRKVKVRITAIDRGMDILWTRTEEKIKHPYTMLAPADGEVGLRIYHEGYGVDKPRNHEEGSIISAPMKNGMIRIRISVSSGDSGSGLFGVKDDLVYGTVFGYDRQSSLAAGVGGISRLRPR